MGHLPKNTYCGRKHHLHKKEATNDAGVQNLHYTTIAKMVMGIHKKQRQKEGEPPGAFRLATYIMRPFSATQKS